MIYDNLTYSTLKDKLKFIDSELELSVDLLTKSYDFINYNYKFDGYIVVSDNEEMRGDLISLQYLNDQNLEDVLLKFNGISNPFSIESGDILFIPNQSSINNVRVESKRDVENKQQDFRLNFNDNLTMQTSPIKDFNDKFNDKVKDIIQNGSGLPPNIADFGDKQFVTKGGKVYFAPNIGKCTTDNKNPISKGELVARLIKNRII